LLFLAYVGAFGSAAAVFFAPVALVSLPLCYAARRMARRDLAKMDKGEMAPQGRDKTTLAAGFATVGLVLGVGTWCCPVWTILLLRLLV
jgi:hypothetical protein